MPPKKFAVGKPGKANVPRRIVRQVAPTGNLADTVMGVVSKYGPQFVDAAKRYGPVVARIMGFGSYIVRNNSLMGMGAPPQFSNGTITVAHREYIQDYQSTTSSFAVQYSENINPGLSTMFNWLSNIANNYETWQPLGMVFMLQPTSGQVVNGTNPAIGGAVQATQYDSADVAFANKQQMEDYEYSTSTRADEAAIHGVECDLTRRPTRKLYVRNANVPSTVDSRLYDLGIYTLATYGNPGNNNVLGELRVSYHIKFDFPRLPVATAGGTFVHTQLGLAAGTTMTTSTWGAAVTTVGVGITSGSINLSGPNITYNGMDDGTTYVTFFSALAATTFTLGSLFVSSFTGATAVNIVCTAVTPDATNQNFANSTARYVGFAFYSPNTGVNLVTLNCVFPSVVTGNASGDIFTFGVEAGVTRTLKLASLTKSLRPEAMYALFQALRDQNGAGVSAVTAAIADMTPKTLKGFDVVDFAPSDKSESAVVVEHSSADTTTFMGSLFKARR